MKAKRFIIITLSGILIGVVLLGLFNIVIDPYFHYHLPIVSKGYSLDHQERFINDGIIRNFEYNAIITGTSVTENFKTSECDDLFDVESVKVSFAGGYYKEINDALVRAFERHDGIVMVIRSLDYSGDYLVGDKDGMNSELNNASTYPLYLYDDNLLNDVSYFWNKSTLIDSLVVIKGILTGSGEISFDQYANWNDRYHFGKEAVLDSFTRGGEIADSVPLSETEKRMVVENIRQNVTDLAEQHPETTFYLFFPPYSICYWDCAYREGKLESTLEAERIAIEELLQYDNIKLFSFVNQFEWVCELDNYKDRVHYGEWINSEILECISRGEGQLKTNNYEEYLKEIAVFYQSYDYEQIYR